MPEATSHFKYKRHHFPGEVRHFGVSPWYTHTTWISGSDPPAWPLFKEINGDKGLQAATYFFWNVAAMDISMGRQTILDEDPFTQDLTVTMPAALEPANRATPWTRPAAGLPTGIGAFDNPFPHRILLPPSDVTPGDNGAPWGNTDYPYVSTDWVNSASYAGECAMWAGFGEIVYSPTLERYQFNLRFGSQIGELPAGGATSGVILRPGAPGWTSPTLAIGGNFASYFDAALYADAFVDSLVSIDIDFTFWTYPAPL